MTSKTKMRLSGNSIAWAGSFVNRTKTYHDYSYTRKIKIFLVHKVSCGINSRRTCERNVLF